jgi:hypothetical protein
MRRVSPGRTEDGHGQADARPRLLLKAGGYRPTPTFRTIVGYQGFPRRRERQA